MLSTASQRPVFHSLAYRAPVGIPGAVAADKAGAGAVDDRPSGARPDAIWDLWLRYPWFPPFSRGLQQMVYTGFGDRGVTKGSHARQHGDDVSSNYCLRDRTGEDPQYAQGGGDYAGDSVYDGDDN